MIGTKFETIPFKMFAALVIHAGTGAVVQKIHLDHPLPATAHHYIRERIVKICVCI